MQIRSYAEPVGRVLELWRYPVSSIGGERLTSIELNNVGVLGDRHFALIDAETGITAAPETYKRWRKALFLTAAYGDANVPAITFPAGDAIFVTDRTMNEKLSDFFGFSVGIGALEVDGFRHLPTAQHRHPHSAVHLLTTASMERLETLCPGTTISSRRFRPTAVIATDSETSFLEDTWVGRALEIGDARITVEERAKRCGMTFLAQPEHEEEPNILRNIVRANQRNLGINCSVSRTGKFRVGDLVTILE